MKVLWLTNNACSALELIDPTNERGGWLASLEKELSCHSDIELHVGFYHGSILKPFRHGQTTFYPLERISKKNKFTRFINRVYKSHDNDKKEIEKIKILIDKLQPNIIHIHGTEDNFGLIQEYTNIPVVISIQGLLNPILEKFFSGIPIHISRQYESIVDKLAFRTARSSYRKLKAGAKRERRILQNARYVIGRTEWDKVVSRVLSPGSTYFEGQEMLRPSFYTKTWDNHPMNGTIKILTVSSDSLFKGFEMIVKVAKLLKNIEGFDFVWIVAGIGKNSYSVRLVRKWLNIDIEKINIKLLGNQTETELADLFDTSHIFCQVSHIENSSNSLCEAQLIGIPIIATDVGGSRSLVQDRVNGVLAQDGDPYFIAGEIIQAGIKFEGFKMMAENGKKLARRRHDKEKVKNQYINVYRQLVRSL